MSLQYTVYLALVPAQGMFVRESGFCTSNARVYACDKYCDLVSEVMPASSILRPPNQSRLTQGSEARFGGLH